MFVAFDGIDGAGKSSQLQAVERFCFEESIDFIELDFGSNPLVRPLLIGAATGDLECSTEIREALFFLEGILTNFETIQKIPKETIAVIDRYTLTYLSYGILNGADERLVSVVVEMLRTPDLYFYMDLEPSIALGRIEQGREKICMAEIGCAGQSEIEFEASKSKLFIDYQTRIRDNMIKNLLPSHFIIDADAPVDSISNDIISIVRREYFRTKV